MFSIHDPKIWARLAPYWDRLFELDPQDRSRWLAELDTRSPDIAAELRCLLEEQAAVAAEGFLSGSPIERMRNESMVGRQISAYRIERLLGRGGMGEVWLASRADGRFESSCAIKFLDLHSASREAVARFRREGRLLGRLEHPNIARLIDAGETDDHRLYLVLEYVHGERIDRYCRSRQLGVIERVRLSLQVLTAVEFAHANLIVHRDLKPANILVTESGVVKLLDFGVAKLISADDFGSDLTANVAPLTPENAAPEQLMGGIPSTATDVYQLGVFLFMLLTGKHPVQAIGTREERIRAILSHTASRASTVVSKSQRKLLQGDLDAILSVALRFEPGERYATAAALRNDLVRFLNDEPVSARNGTSWYTMRKFLARHKGTAIIASLAIVALCTALAYALVQADEARSAAHRANAQAAFLSLMVAQVGEPGRPITASQVLAKGIEILEARYADDPAFMIDELGRMASRYMDLGDRKRQREVLLKAEAIARRQSDPVFMARVECNLAETEAMVGELASAESRLAFGTSALTRTRQDTFLDEAGCLRAAGALRQLQGRTQEAIASLERAATLLDRHHAEDHGGYAALVSALGLLYSNVGDLRRGYEAQRKAHLLLEKNGLTGTLFWVGALHNEATALENMGELREALEVQSQVVRFGRQQDPEGCGTNPAVLNLFARLLLRLGRGAEAVDVLGQARACSQRSGDMESWSFATAARALALVSVARLTEAGAMLDEFGRANRSNPKLNLRAVSRAKIARAYWLAANGERAAARALSAELLSEVRKPELGMMQFLDDGLLLASRLALPENVALAQSYAEEALRIDESRSRVAENSADVGEAALVLAQARLAARNLSGAQNAAERAKSILNRTLGPDHALTRAAEELIRETRPAM